ncbi:MAG: phycobiliprotein lyase [Gloeomargarita sp. SKYBB_i_bin120]|nr:phycobiliprotein lyase [Gloeomargarita sp. SKYG98]MCS7291865.1 phycobiliprotein lyase [Gloeomargarita sp. SKYB120]MDW8177425.1 phycobiliprotein lyase [Gloeomargarita sp. SKYBB_i_bin120]
MTFTDLEQLLQHHVGTWICQRTRFYLDGAPANHGKAQLQVANLGPDAPHSLGLVLTWTENNQPVGRTTLAFDPASSCFWHYPAGGSPATGHYTWDSHGVLELTLAGADGLQIQERLWFAAPNLRLRTVLVRNQQGLVAASFYSDIRRLT